MHAKQPFSLEFFPPKTPQGAEKLRGFRQELYAIQPEYCSVTFGAGGSTQDGTRQTIIEIRDEGYIAAPHLSCIGSDRARLTEIINDYKSLGVKKLVALRGDLPSGYGGMGEFRYASDLVALIRELTGDWFEIEVGAYPETHPQAKSPAKDIDAFVTKVRAGADAAITQYFYNADAYFHFVDEVNKQGVNIPIIPGVMPILNFSQLARFSDACGAEIPRWIRSKLESYADDTESIQAFGLEVVTQLCERLLAAGAPGIHFYTMNQAKPVLDLVRNLGHNLGRS
jgi:methylenetetrahydrofolate reductase (NADPH)